MISLETFVEEGLATCAYSGGFMRDWTTAKGSSSGLVAVVLWVRDVSASEQENLQTRSVTSAI